MDVGAAYTSDHNNSVSSVFVELREQELRHCPTAFMQNAVVALD